MTTPPITITSNEVADEFRRRFALEYELVVASLTVRKLQHELEHARAASADMLAQMTELRKLEPDGDELTRERMKVRGLTAEVERLTKLNQDYGVTVDGLRAQLTQVRRRGGRPDLNSTPDTEKVEA